MLVLFHAMGIPVTDLKSVTEVSDRKVYSVSMLEIWSVTDQNLAWQYNGLFGHWLRSQSCNAVFCLAVTDQTNKDTARAKIGHWPEMRSLTSMMCACYFYAPCYFTTCIPHRRGRKITLSMIGVWTPYATLPLLILG